MSGNRFDSQTGAPKLQVIRLPSGIGEGLFPLF
jgi:hypothetical protein